MSNFYSAIAHATTSEAHIETVVEALALRGAFDNWLDGDARPYVVKRAARGRADVELISDGGRRVLGIEVKLWSQVNWGYYGAGEPCSQFERMSADLCTLIIVTAQERASREGFPARATVLTLEELAALAEQNGLTAEDVFETGVRPARV